MTKKIILIDVDGTLLDFMSCAETAIRMGFDEIGIACEDFADTYHEINDGLWRALERGEITREELYDRRFELVFEALGLDADGRAFERIFRRNLALTGDKIDGAEDLLEYLSAKYDVYVASNAPQAQQVNRMEIAGLLPYVKDVFTSERLGAQKPTKEFFDRCLSCIDGATRENTVMIGDSLTADVKGGVEAGITTVWYNFKKEAIPTDFAGDYVVSQLTDIKSIL